MNDQSIITGLNHITLSVKNLDISIEFYSSVLDFTLVKKWERGCYLDLNGLWLCLTLCDAPAPATDYSHIAFSLAQEDLNTAKTRIEKINARIWQDNKSEGDSIYFLDPDGHQLELHVGSLSTRLKSLAKPSPA